MSVASRRGAAGEQAAIAYFQNLGYHLLTHNFRTRRDQALSEIDLILLAINEKAPKRFTEAFLQVRQDGKVERLFPQGREHLSIVFVEVKNWQAYPLADLCYNLNAGRQKRMFRTAECFLQQNPDYADLKWRFDLLVFQGSEPVHLPAAFS